MRSAFQTIRVEVNGACATVTLARPEARNALDEAMVGELAEAFEALARIETLRAVVLAGDGPALCAGADIKAMKRAGALDAAANEADATRLARMFELWRDLPCPTLVLAHGAALGGGMGLVAAADIAIAEEGCKFGFTEVRLGLIPSVISQVTVPAIGARRAHRWFLTGEVFTGRRAYEIGLVSEVVPDGSGRARLDEVVAHVLSVGPRATREAKALLKRYAGDAGSWPGATDLARIIARLRASAEGQEGLAAFLEKRDPNWRVRP